MRGPLRAGPAGHAVRHHERAAGRAPLRAHEAPGGAPLACALRPGCGSQGPAGRACMHALQAQPGLYNVSLACSLVWTRVSQPAARCAAGRWISGQWQHPHNGQQGCTRSWAPPPPARQVEQGALACRSTGAACRGGTTTSSRATAWSPSRGGRSTASRPPSRAPPAASAPWAPPCARLRPSWPDLLLVGLPPAAGWPRSGGP